MSQIKIREQLRHYMKGSVFSIKAMIKWLVLTGVAGVIVVVFTSMFGHVLIAVNQFRTTHPAVILCLPLGGLTIVFLYRFFKETYDKGTHMVISSNHSSTSIPFRMEPLIFVAAVISHLFGGSAGREGAAIQQGGSIANHMSKIIRLNANDQHIIMYGMSAGFSALFGTPMAATIFSLEVISVGIMHYSALVPCVTVSMIAHFIAQLLRVPPEVFPVAAQSRISSY